MDEPKPTSQRKRRHWLRALRPLLWWLLLVLVLFLIHTHQRLSERTSLTFSASLQGRPVAFEASAKLDGKPVVSGSRIAIGRHSFSLSHPKAVSFSTNMFIWYGEHNLGDIALTRGTGVLSIDVRPPAKLVTIRGPEFSTTLTNSTGLTSSVPTDAYLIEAHYGHWREDKQVTVTAGATSTVRIAPNLGDVELSCNRSQAMFRLIGPDKGVIEDDFPATIAGVPAGTYKLVAEHHRNRREEMVVIKAGGTNSVRVEFVYGAAVIETEPPGAMVTTGDGTELGWTPRTLAELPPGIWQFALHRAEYEPVQVLLEVRANETNSVHTNLVNSTFASALARGENALKSHQYHAAVIALTEALQHTQGDERATTLLRQAKVSEALESAVARASVGDYRAALEQVEIALAISPDLERAKQLAAEYKKVITESEAKARQTEAAFQRERHPSEYFDALMQTTVHSPLFDRQEMRSKGKVAEIEKRVVYALTNQAPAFKLLAEKNPDVDTFFISVTQGVSLGRRRVDLVIGQANDAEAKIIFKVFEYALPMQSALRALVGKVEDKDMLPIHPSRLGPNDSGLLPHRAEGIWLVRDRIQKAVGE